MIMGHKSNTHLIIESNSVNYCRKLFMRSLNVSIIKGNV